MAENETPRLKLPFPSGKGKVKLGAVDIEELAERLDVTLPSNKAIIAAEQSRENTAFGVLATPDEVTVVLPGNGLIAVAYQAVWEGSVGGNGEAAIFVGGTQLKVAHPGQPSVQGALTSSFAPKALASLCTCGLGLASINSNYTSDVTTGQVIGVAGGKGEEEEVNCTIAGNVHSLAPAAGGPCYVFAAAGTYKITVQFRAITGKVTVKNRKLWAWVVA